MRLLSFFVSGLLFLSLVGCSVSSKFVNKPTWREEFYGSGSPNKAMWTRSVSELNDTYLSVFCDEDSNAYVKNGKLHLRVFKTNDPKKPYKAGRVIIKKDFNFKKGRLVIKAKAPVSRGLWKAIWLNGPRTKDGYFAELDLMEHVHAQGDSCYTAVYHLWGDFGGKEKNHVSYGQNVPIAVDGWHIYTLEVTDDRIQMIVDGRLMYDIYKGKFGDEWPEDQDYSLRIGMSYGGYGAQRDGIDDSALPAEMLVDYVRFYELKDDNRS